MTGITIHINGYRDGLIRCVIHELLHIYMSQLLQLESRMTYELEEDAVLSWEQRLYSYVHDPRRAKLGESWVRAIDRKLAG